MHSDDEYNEIIFFLPATRDPELTSRIG